MEHHVQCSLLAGDFREMEIPTAFQGRGSANFHHLLGLTKEKPGPMRVMLSCVLETSQLSSIAESSARHRSERSNRGANAATAAILALFTNAQIARETSNDDCAASGHSALEQMG